MHFVSDTVKINHIDSTDTTFKITNEISTDDLIKSINHVGLISPPILKLKANNRYIVVSGFRRIAACHFLGWGHIDARIVSVDESDLNCFKLSIADNAQNRQLNVIEQAVSISKLSIFFSNDDVALSQESKKLGLNVNTGLIKKLKEINTVHAELKKKIATGVIPLTIGLELGELEHGTAIVFSQIIEELNPTLNHQKEIIRLSKEISRLNNVPMSDIINDCIIADTINDPELDRNQKIKKIRRKLKQIRYPEIVRFETKYFALMQRIKLPESIHLIPPVNFEGNTYSINLVFQNLAQFKDINKILNKMQNHPDFAKIIEKELEDN
ncbi:MAG: ParB N-terminal domain-containing protein [Desulfobacteraceae bacterium]|nr:ParB N-terminal domain-containing protein [Desulfobacteraceae bacterium]MBC2756514.1 ParB N-terminal domain-containing protein [Desulfobacteraceae bacterium]